MKNTILATVTALIVGAAATAHAENPLSTFSAVQQDRSAATSVIVPAKTYPSSETNAASLSALITEWDRAGFTSPSKPSQYRVYGRNGYVTSGPGYNTMVALIRSAVNDAQHGRDRDAAISIAKARGLLASISPSAGTRTNG